MDSDESLIAQAETLRPSAGNVHALGAFSAGLRLYNGTYLNGQATDKQKAARLRAILEIFINGRMTLRDAERQYDKEHSADL